MAEQQPPAPQIEEDDHAALDWKTTDDPERLKGT